MAISVSNAAVSVTVSTTIPGVTVKGVTKPMIPSFSATWTERIRAYAKLSDVLGDFAATTVEYLAAQAIYSQNPAITDIVIGRVSGKPTEVLAITVAMVNATSAYNVNAFVTGVLQAVTYTPQLSAAWVTITAYATGYLLTADTGKLYICITAGTSSVASPPTGTAADITDGTVHWMYAGTGGAGVTTNDAIAYNLAKALNALAAPAPNFAAALTGSVGSKIVTCTGSAAGNWFALEVPQRALLGLANTTANTLAGGSDATMADALTAINLADSSWFGFVTTFQSIAIIEASAAWAEPAGKFYRAASNDSAIATVADGSATDVAHAVKALAYNGTCIGYSPRGWEFLDAGSMGRWFAIPVGKQNWTYKPIPGATAENYTPTEVVNMTAKYAFWYGFDGSDPVILGEGRQASGMFTDTFIALTYDAALTLAALTNLRKQNENIPYTRTGAALIENALESLNAGAVAAGWANPGSGTTTDPSPTVVVPTAASQSSSDRGLRRFVGCQRSYRLSGGINFMAVNIIATT